MTWDRAIADYCGYLTAIGRSESTITLRRFQLQYVQQSLNLAPERITEADLLDWFARHDWQPETRRSYRSGVRGFFAWALSAGVVATDPAAAFPAIRVPKSAAKPTPEIIYRNAVQAAAPRTRLMLRLAAEAGLRRAEISRVHTRDLRESASGYELLIHGKGAHERVVPLSASLAALIAAGPAGHTLGERSHGWLFPSRKGGHIGATRVGTLCSAAMPDVWTVHKLRHRFATRAYQGSHDIRAVQRLLGHSNLAITERYTFTDDEAMRAAMMSAA